MTVKELIERLQRLNPEIMVRAYDEIEGMLMPITDLNVHALAADLQTAIACCKGLAPKAECYCFQNGDDQIDPGGKSYYRGELGPRPGYEAVANILPFRPTPPTPPQRIYFPVQDEYVVIGQLPDGRYTAHLEDAIGTARGHGSTMLEAIADLVVEMGREECN